MSLPIFERSPLKQAFADLRNNLIGEDGPRISTMRNHNFAIVQYEPKHEFECRRLTQQLSNDLVASGWAVHTIDLQHLLLQRIRAQGPEWLEWAIDCEREFAEYDPTRGLNFLKDELAPLIEGPDGLAADCARVIRDHIDGQPDEADQADRTLALIGRAGALYPFFRSSALLKHLAGRTENIPIVLLYPGERRGQTGLSFMGIHEPDNDYRPRIYP